MSDRKKWKGLNKNRTDDINMYKLTQQNIAGKKKTVIVWAFERTRDVSEKNM